MVGKGKGTSLYKCRFIIETQDMSFPWAWYIVPAMVPATVHRYWLRLADFVNTTSQKQTGVVNEICTGEWLLLLCTLYIHWTIILVRWITYTWVFRNLLYKQFCCVKNITFTLTNFSSTMVVVGNNNASILPTQTQQWLAPCNFTTNLKINAHDIITTGKWLPKYAHKAFFLTLHKLANRNDI